MLRSVIDTTRTTLPIRLGLGAVLLGAVAAAPASAAEGPTVAVVGLHQSELTTEDQQRAIAGIAAAIEASGRFDALVGDEVIGTIQGREKIILEDGLLASARLSLASGKNAYNQASSEEAIAHLESAIEEFRFGMAATNTVEELWEAWVYAGSSHLQKDPPDEAAARDAFVNAVALSPSRPINPALFPPNVVEAFDAVKAEMSAAPATLKIAITPQVTGDIRVWVDGVDRGPAARVDVLPGEHHVMIRGAGTQGYARVVVPVPPPVAPSPDAPVDGEPVEGAETPAEPPAEPEPVLQDVLVTLDLPSLGEAARSPAGRAAQIGGLYRAIGNRADGLNYVFVAGVDGSTLYLQLLDPETDTFSKSMEVPFSGPADDEAVQSVPLLLNIVDPQGRFNATAATAAPIAIGTNSVLALMLTQPKAVAATSAVTTTKRTKAPKTPKAHAHKSKAGVVLGVVGGVVAAGAASGAVYALTRDGSGGAGTVVVQF